MWSWCFITFWTFSPTASSFPTQFLFSFCYYASSNFLATSASSIASYTRPVLIKEYISRRPSVTKSGWFILPFYYYLKHSWLYDSHRGFSSSTSFSRFDPVLIKCFASRRPSGTMSGASSLFFNPLDDLICHLRNFYFFSTKRM